MVFIRTLKFTLLPCWYLKSQVVWTSAETDQFYEAIEAFGSDLMMVRAIFKNKTDVQVKNKYKLELKRNPKRMADALEKKDRPNPRDFFEKKCKTSCQIIT